MTRRSADGLRLALTLAGLAISAYLTLLHYDANVPLACSRGALVDCETVLGSPSATVAGVPVAVWGLVWFVPQLAMVAMSLRAGDRPEPAALRRAALLWILGGVVGVLWLVYQEIGVIGKICAWCTGVHVIILALLVVHVVSEPTRPATAAL
jgi:uncharacterized membrane protein